jgi:DNA-directed RNA polymerase specialized sigma24 family protein
MGNGPELPPEYGIVSARIGGALSVDASFKHLYEIYASVVQAWLVLRVETHAVEDLMQDVWTVFYRRWQSWQQSPEMDVPEARPVLSFLFRTVHLASKAHNRGRQNYDPIDGIDPPDQRVAPQRLFQRLLLGRCLELARTQCSPDDLEILLGKLGGVSAKDIARTLCISESAVDHRYRSVVEFLRGQLHSRPLESKGLGRIS